MAITRYNKNIGVSPDLPLLETEINADATISPKTVDTDYKLSYSDGGLPEDPANNLRVTMSDSLTAAEETALDAVIAAHAPPAAADPVAYHTGARMGNVGSVVLDATQQEIDGVVTSVGILARNKAKAFGRVVGQHKSTGAGAEIKVVETQDDGTVTQMNSTPYSLPDTAGAWKTFGFSTDVEPNGARCAYTVEATLGAATSCEVRFIALSLLETV